MLDRWLTAEPRCSSLGSVSPLRSSFFNKTLRSGDTLIPQGLLAGVLLWLGWQAQRIGWNVWGRGSCCPPGLHCRTAPAPAAPQRPRRSTAPARRAMGMLHPVQYNTQVKQAVAAGQHSPRPQMPTRWPVEPKQQPAACGISVAAAQQFFQQKLRSGDTLIPQGLLAGVLLWLGWQAQRIGWNVWGRGSCCPPGLHCRTAPSTSSTTKAPAQHRLRAPGHGDAAPGAVQHPSKTGSSSWPPDASGDAAPVAAQQFFQQNLRSGDTLIPQGLLAGVLLWLGWQAQRIGWNVWGRGSCCPPGLHCRTAPAPAAPQRPRRSTAPARRAMGMLHPVQYNTQVKQAAAAGQYAQAPDGTVRAGSRARRQPSGIRVVAAQQFFNKTYAAAIR